MRIILQRVKKAAVKVDGEIVAEIGHGLLLLLGVCRDDTLKRAEYLADKCAELRIFEDENGKMNLSLLNIRGQALVVSQFTLCADISKGRRPSFGMAMPPQQAELLYEEFCRLLEGKGIDVKNGRFGAKMAVELVNDGPVTILLEN